MLLCVSPYPSADSIFEALSAQRHAAVEDTECAEQPKDDADDHNDVENLLDLAVHWDVRIDSPKDNANNHERDNETDESHCLLLLETGRYRLRSI